MLMASSDTYFFDVIAHFSLKVATNNSFRDKKNYENLDFLGILLQQKRRSATKEIDVFVSDKSGMFMAWSGIYFLEVSVHVSPKVATKDFFRDKQTMKI